MDLLTRSMSDKMGIWLDVIRRCSKHCPCGKQSTDISQCLTHLGIISVRRSIHTIALCTCQGRLVGEKVKGKVALRAQRQHPPMLSFLPTTADLAKKSSILCSGSVPIVTSGLYQCILLSADYNLCSLTEMRMAKVGCTARCIYWLSREGYISRGRPCLGKLLTDLPCSCDHSILNRFSSFPFLSAGAYVC